MKASKRTWGVVAIMAIPLGIFIGKYGLLQPTPAAFAICGMLAALCTSGIVYGVREGQRVARDQRPLSS